MKKGMKNWLPVGLPGSRVLWVVVGLAAGGLVTASAVGPYVTDDGIERTLYVFGAPKSQPPSPSSVVSVGPFELGIAAQQVCGYTDWSTAAIRLPKKLLNKDYWAGKIGQMRDQAIQAAMDLTGALPSMLACNASPTFCSVINHAELLSQYEFKFTVDTCRILEGLENATVINEGLRNCIKLQMQTGAASSPSEAREFCMGQNQKTATETNSKDFFSPQKFFNAICPEVEQAQSPYYKSAMGSGGRRYTRTKRTCRFARELIPGFTVNGSARFVTGGTFGVTIEQQITEYADKTASDVNEVVKAMASLYWGSAKRPNDVISDNTLRSKWSSSSWGDTPPMYMRATSDGSEPQFLVPPEQMFQLMQLVDRKKGVEGDYANRSSPYRQALDRVSRSAAYVHSVDGVSDLLTRSLEKCASANELQGAVAQENCRYVGDQLKTQLQILAQRREAESEFLRTQAEVSTFVSTELSRRQKDVRPVAPTLPKDTAVVPVPGSF